MKVTNFNRLGFKEIKNGTMLSQAILTKENVDKLELNEFQ